MKKFFAILFFTSIMCGLAFAQNSYPEIEIAREIKLLRSTHQDVIRIMAEFDRDKDDDRDDYQEFRSDRAKVIVYFSTDECPNEQWNVSKQTATKVEISFDEATKPEDLGLNLSAFKKRLEDEEYPEDYAYYNENAGIVIFIYDNEVSKVILHPSKKQTGYLCVNEGNAEILSGKMSFTDEVLQTTGFCDAPNFPVDVTNLDLKPNGVFGCKDENCADAKKEISVRTTAVDPENDVVTYDYTVSGGKIVGSGFEVVWDLTGVAPGIYSIRAGANDGAGIIGETKGQKILVKENSYELVSPAKIQELILDKTKLVAACPVGRLKRVRCPSGNCSVSVTTVAALSYDGGNFTYKYKVFDGEIIGSGERVVWDLSGLKPGKYEITAEVSDDGLVFGNPKTATVEIVENPACKV